MGSGDRGQCAIGRSSNQRSRAAGAFRANGLAGAYEIEARIGAPRLATQDVTEGLNAFVEKRTPLWQGR